MNPKDFLAMVFEKYLTNCKLVDIGTRDWVGVSELNSPVSMNLFGSLAFKENDTTMTVRKYENDKNKSIFDSIRLVDMLSASETDILRALSVLGLDRIKNEFHSLLREANV